MWMIFVIKSSRNCVFKTAKVLTRPKWVLKWRRGHMILVVRGANQILLSPCADCLKLDVYTGSITVYVSWYFMHWIHSKIYAGGLRCITRDHSGYGLSQWEAALLCNASSHWPSPYSEWSQITFWCCQISSDFTHILQGNLSVNWAIIRLTQCL